MSAILTWFSILFFGGPLSQTAPDLDLQGPVESARAVHADNQDVERSPRSGNDDGEKPPFWDWINNPISNGF